MFKNAAQKADTELRSVFAADIKVDGVKAKFLSDSPFPDAYREFAAGGYYSANTGLLEPLKAWAVANAPTLKRYWHIECKDSQSPGAIFNKLCRAFDLEVEQTEWTILADCSLSNSAIGILNTPLANLGVNKKPGKNVKLYRLINLDAPDRRALLAALDAKAAKHSDVKDWISSLPMPRQIDMYQSAREGASDVCMEAYEAYRLDRGIVEPLQANDRARAEKTLLEMTTQFFGASLAKAEADELQERITLLFMKSIEFSGSDAEADLEIAF